MTRFARAEGSKGSNRREEEEATPWNVLVQQVKGRYGGVEDEEEDYAVERDDGPEEAKDDKMIDSDDEKDSGVDEVIDTSILDQSDDEMIEDNPILGGVKRPVPLLESSEEPKKKKRKKSQKCKVCGDKGHWKKDCEKLPEERRQELQDLYTMKVERKGQGTGRKKNKSNLASILSDNKENDSLEDGETKVEVSKNKSKKKKNNKNKRNANVEQKQIVKDRSGATIEKGEVLFQGFRVTKEDQLRLKKLQTKLKSSGISKLEMDEALKRERRKAEKTLARSKKLVCFNCREPGHMLADCPNKNDVTCDTMPGAAGHCFKCGSLEHTSKDCKSKLKRENAYRFAVCFICKQEGHLAKACPDNPKGLYPNGGGCVFCGSVEHLKRDCPRKLEKDLKSGVKLEMMGDDGLEDEPSHMIHKQKKQNNKPKKIVAF